jgi:putative sterol carrier protein
MTDQTIQDFMTKLPKAFKAEKAAGLDVTLQFKLTGPQADEWFAVIKDSKCTISQGTAPAAKLTVTIESGDFMKLFTGELDGMQAFMQGKIRLVGDMNLALKMLSLFQMN